MFRKTLVSPFGILFHARIPPAQALFAETMKTYSSYFRCIYFGYKKILHPMKRTRKSRYHLYQLIEQLTLVIDIYLYVTGNGRQYRQSLLQTNICFGLNARKSIRPSHTLVHSPTNSLLCFRQSTLLCQREILDCLLY